MAKPLETALLSAAGLGLFGLCYVGFAAVGGVPMHSLPLLGGFFPVPPPVEDPLADLNASPAETAQAELLYPDRPSPRLAKELIGASLGVIGSFAVHAPFDREELESLVTELEARETTLSQRLRDVDDREAQVEEQLLALQERSKDLDDLRDEIAAQSAVLEVQFQELAKERAAFQRERDAAKETDQDRMRRKAELFSEGEPDIAAQRLLPLGPEEGGKLLKLLEPSRAREILDTMTGENWAKFAEAYTSGS